MGPEGGGADGDAVSAVGEVAARVEDLRAFCEAGERHVPALIGIFDAIGDLRRVTNQAMAGAATPLARVATGGQGSTDPLAELIAEARINNAFVRTVHDSLECADLTIGGLRVAPVALVDRPLRAAGLATVGEDATLDEDRALATALVTIDIDRVRESLTDEQRAEVAAYRAQLDTLSGLAVPVRVDGIDDPDVRLVVADMIIEQAAIDGRDASRSRHLPFGHEPWMGVVSLVDDIEGMEGVEGAESPEGIALQAFVAQRLVEEGLALEAEAEGGQVAPGTAAPGGTTEGFVRPNLQATATVVVTLGLSAMSEPQLHHLIDDLADDLVDDPGDGLDGGPGQARLIVEALDLDGDGSAVLDRYAETGVAPLGRGDRQRALAALLEVAVDGEGVVAPGGQVLFEVSIDELTRSGWNPGLPSEGGRGTPGNDLRVALVAIAGAPNFGLTEVEYHQALEADRLLAELPPTPTDAEWHELDVALAALGDAQTVDLILSAMMADLPAAEAMRIARSAEARPQGPHDRGPDRSPTDDRVDLLRLLLGTDAMGNPPWSTWPRWGACPSRRAGR